MKFSSLLIVIFSIASEVYGNSLPREQTAHHLVRRQVEPDEDIEDRIARIGFDPSDPEISRSVIRSHIIDDLEGEIEREEEEGEEDDCEEPDEDQDPIPRSRFVPKFDLYYRGSNGGVPITTETIPDGFDASRRTIFIVHGWEDSSASGWQLAIKDEFLRHGDYNVIIVDWSANNPLWYPRAAANTRIVGREIARLSQVLVNSKGLPRRQLYCVGHSLGGQSCGFAGKNYKFGRITGLDPAGPWFRTNDPTRRIDRCDAYFVDIIHTTKLWGLKRPVGHVDFYPNGGVNQPGCFGQLGCAHGRAHQYFKESINNPCFDTRLHCDNHNNLPNSCTDCGSFCQSMGFEAETKVARGMFYLKTSGSEPFCLPGDEGMHPPDAETIPVNNDQFYDLYDLGEQGNILPEDPNEIVEAAEAEEGAEDGEIEDYQL